MNELSYNDLEALPVGSKVRDNCDDVWTKTAAPLRCWSYTTADGMALRLSTTTRGLFYHEPIIAVTE